jgi:prepilin-type N-terminal cleavage/methylation domain-containing protein
MKTPAYKSGMTLVETLIAVAIVGVLATAVFVPAVTMSLRCQQNAECTHKLRTAVAAFELYASETGGYPPNRQAGSVPPEMADYYFPYFKIDWWSDDTELGGKWDWDVDQNGFNFSVSINDPARSQPQMEEFDQLVDDGNLATGNFRKAGAKYHYIIEQ